MRDVNQGPCLINNSTIVEKPKQTNVGDFSNQKSNGLGGGQGKKSGLISKFGKMILGFFMKKIFHLSEPK